MTKHSQHPNQFFAATLTNIAREFRREPTAAEKALWQLIRLKQLAGWKFRRQHPIGRYIADFCCPKAHLIIEVDGEIHRQQVEADQETLLPIFRFGKMGRSRRRGHAHLRTV